jgi:hypothetical protein
MDYVGREFEECSIVKEPVDPYGIEGFGRVEENCVCYPLFTAVSDYSFTEVGQLQECAMPVSEPKLVVSR